MLDMTELKMQILFAALSVSFKSVYEKLPF